MMKVRRILAGPVCLALASGVGCQLVGGVHETLELGGEGGAGTCGHAWVPDRPPTASSDDGATFTWAFHKIWFGATGADGGPLGLDLDDACSCKAQGQRCVLPDKSNGACDGPDGRDNAIQTFFQQWALLFGGDAAATYNGHLDQGRWSALVEVSGYNGLGDDDQVTVAFYPSTGFATNDPQGVPAWAGADAWHVPSDVLQQGGAPVYVDPKAYVRGSILVAQPGALSVRLKGLSARLEIVVTSPVLTARLAPVDGGGFLLRDGQIAGKIAANGIFQMMASFRSEEGKPLCRDDPFYTAGRASLCHARDIQADSPDPALPCDALSFAMGFQADLAVRGGVADAEAPAQFCSPGQSPTTDVCE
jgi:hypothetical protein